MQSSVTGALYDCKSLAMRFILFFTYWTVPSEVHFGCKIDDTYIDCLVLLILRWNWTKFIFDFITRQWYILTFNTAIKITYNCYVFPIFVVQSSLTSQKLFCYFPDYVLLFMPHLPKGLIP